jgi:hypothetical protein
MEGDVCEDADEGEWRGRIDQKDSCSCDPNHPEHHTEPAKALAIGWGPEHGHPEDNDT